MQLKRYEASTVNEAFQRIKAELGSDAVIFSTRTIGSRTGQRTAARRVEVIAAVERSGANSLHSPSKECMIKQSTADAADATTADTSFSYPAANSGERPEQNAADIKGAGQSRSEFEPYFHEMVRAGFEDKTAWYLIGEACSDYKRSHKSTSLQTVLLRKIAEYLPASAPLRVSAGSCKAVALIGPTGVGKTTTLAKLAAQFSLVQKARVKIVTFDTYRIAAVEQLKVYGRIMSIPVEVATSTEELSAQLNAGGTDLVLIDTAGINYKSKDSIHDLLHIFSTFPQIESHLVLSATSSDTVLRGAFRHFAEARADRLILSKVDECFLFGSMYDFIISANLPVSYITTGQRVPEDLEQASAYTLARMFLKGYN